jgi:hypothetical protein
MMARMIRRLVPAMGMTALGGLVVWAVVAAVAWRVDDARLDLPTVLLLFGQLVIVPVGLGLVDGGGPSVAVALHRGGRFGVRAGSVAALAALAVPRGELSAAVAALYLLPVGAIGLAALLRVAADGRRQVRDVAEVAAVGFLAVGPSSSSFTARASASGACRTTSSSSRRSTFTSPATDWG